MSFEDFQFHPQIMAGIKACGYTSPTPIQREAMPPILAGRDILGLAQTGTGKTAAFVLPILQRLMGDGRGSIRYLNSQCGVHSPIVGLKEFLDGFRQQPYRCTIGYGSSGCDGGTTCNVDGRNRCVILAWVR